MSRYFFQIHGEPSMGEDPEGIALSSHRAAMLRAVTMCAEVGLSGGFRLGFAVSVRGERGAAIGRVSVVVSTAAAERPDA